MRVFLVSYATPRFEGVRRDLVKSAVEWNIVNVLSFDESYLHGSAFYAENKRLLDEPIGAGYWAWKPYFILEALKLVELGDIVFYCDAGSAFISSPERLIELCRANERGLVLFDARPLTNRQFTKRDCFVRMNCDTAAHWDSYKVIATALLCRKSPFVVDFLEEWLRFSRDRVAVTDDPSSCGLPELDEFLQHRWDQAILSVLASKHRLETYRNPTLWGNYLKLPEFRVSGEKVTSPYELLPSISDYAEAPQGNSPYGTILEINRLPNYVGKSPLPASAFAAPVEVPRTSVKRFSFLRRSGASS